MKKDFKYPLLNVFFDVDQVPCVFEKEVLETYPNIDKFTINYKAGNIHQEREFSSFVWDIGTENVMAVVDVEQFVRLYIETKNATDVGMEEFDVSMISKCDICDTLLLPDDELYVDGEDKRHLCDGHSSFDEDKDYYIGSDKIVYGTMRAFDKSSGESFWKTLRATTTEQADEQFKEFEESVPFTKWYYEIEIDEFLLDLSERQLQIVENLEELI